MIDPITAEAMKADYAAALPGMIRALPRTPRQMLEEFSEETGIPLRDLKSPKRTWDISHPRQDLMLKMREYGFSLKTISHQLHRDHTTVVHGIARATERRDGK